MQWPPENLKRSQSGRHEGAQVLKNAVLGWGDTIIPAAPRSPCVMVTVIIIQGSQHPWH